MAKLTRSRRPAADSRAARNTPLTAAKLAAPDVVRMRTAAVAAREGKVNTPLTAAKLAAPDGVRMRATAFADREGEVAAPWAPTLGPASAPRRSRRQPARPRSSYRRSPPEEPLVISSCRLQCLQIVGKRGRGVAAGAQAREFKVNAPDHRQVAPQTNPLPGPGVEKRAALLVAVIVVRLALVPVGKAGSITRHAAAPTLGRAEPRLVLVEPEP
eukprot:scaffold8422_cov82-Phaeocystis_antarctica.AAC.2